CAQAIGFPLTF
nr:immunoglobulin light chain junction region [Macaca mulatta]